MLYKNNKFSEIAKDYFDAHGEFEVKSGILSPVSSAYKKKVSFFYGI